jgi:hypothetical protein
MIKSVISSSPSTFPQGVGAYPPAVAQQVIGLKNDGGDGAAP